MTKLKKQVFAEWMEKTATDNPDCRFSLMRRGFTDWYDLAVELPSAVTYYIPLDMILETKQSDPVAYIQSMINKFYDWDMGISPYEPMHYVENIEDISTEEWLEKRRGGIGGSDASSLFGLNGFTTDSDLFHDKRGTRAKEPDDDSKWFMLEFGHTNEALIAQLFQRKHPELKVVFRRQMFSHPKYPWMIVNCDGFVIDPANDKVYILEIKTCNPFILGKQWGSIHDTSYPKKYGKQCCHGMCVTNTDGTWLVCCAGNDATQLYRERFIPRDMDEEAVLIDVEKDFWNNVNKNIVPKNRFTYDYMAQQIYEEMTAMGHGGETDISNEVETVALILKYMNLRDQRSAHDAASRELKSKEDEIMEPLKAILAGNKVSFTYGDKKYSGKPGKVVTRHYATEEGLKQLRKLYEDRPDELAKVISTTNIPYPYSFGEYKEPKKKTKKL